MRSPEGVEIGRLQWRKSTYSESVNDCVEVTDWPGGGKAVRDSKNTHLPALVFSASEWAAFIRGVKDGQFD